MIMFRNLENLCKVLLSGYQRCVNYFELLFYHLVLKFHCKGCQSNQRLSILETATTTKNNICLLAFWLHTVQTVKFTSPQHAIKQTEQGLAPSKILKGSTDDTTFVINQQTLCMTLNLTLKEKKCRNLFIKKET